MTTSALNYFSSFVSSNNSWSRAADRAVTICLSVFLPMRDYVSVVLCKKGNFYLRKDDKEVTWQTENHKGEGRGTGQQESAEETQGKNLCWQHIHI